MSDGKPLLELDGVSKAYAAAQTPAVDAVTLRVHERQLVAIVGASGSGKTTLLKTINRLIEADAGSIRLAGDDVTSLEPHRLRRRIGYVFQGIGLFPHMSVGENIAVTPQLLGWPKARIAARVAELLDVVRLPQAFISRMPAALSGGQQQRVGVARALAAGPGLMLMDEPFAALDPITREALGTEYRLLHERMQLTTLMVTHDVLEAVLLADRIVVMRDGGIAADGPPRDLLSDAPDAGVRALMDVPRRQGERVHALIASAGARPGSGAP